jgi:hypothetical protein
LIYYSPDDIIITRILRDLQPNLNEALLLVLVEKINFSDIWLNFILAFAIHRNMQKLINAIMEGPDFEIHAHAITVIIQQSPGRLSLQTVKELFSDNRVKLSTQQQQTAVESAGKTGRLDNLEYLLKLFELDPSYDDNRLIKQLKSRSADRVIAFLLKIPDVSNNLSFAELKRLSALLQTLKMTKRDLYPI